MDQWWEQYREKREAATDHRVCLFVRSLAPIPGQHSRRAYLISGLEKAASSPILDSFEITSLGTEICTCEACRAMGDGDEILGTVLQLKEWRTGGIRSTGFTEKTVDSSVTGDHYESIVPPEVTFGIYIDGVLTGVFPCVADGAVHSPTAYLETLLSDQPHSSSEVHFEASANR